MNPIHFDDYLNFVLQRPVKPVPAASQFQPVTRKQSTRSLNAALDVSPSVDYLCVESYRGCYFVEDNNAFCLSYLKAGEHTGFWWQHYCEVDR